MSELILYEVDSDGIGLITVNRPEVRNALNWAAMEQLADVVQRAEADDDLRVLLMTGQGRKAFIAGGDLRDLHNYKTREDAYRQHDLMADTMARLTRMPVPVIAALEGATRGGGCEVALAADIRVAASDATLAFSQVRMGLTPGWGGARRLYSLVGYRTAMDYLLTGRVITVPEARISGLVDLTAKPGSALEEARRIAEGIVQNPPLAVRGIKEVLLGYHLHDIEEARRREREVFARLWVTDDHDEAATAFLEKREPRFTGK